MTGRALIFGVLICAAFFAFGALVTWQWAQSFPDLTLGAK